jgi:uncharacterized protein YdeI (BOF family)
MSLTKINRSLLLGGGPINYALSNADAEDNGTTGYVVYQDTAGTSPVNGAGTVVDGTPITFTASTSSPLRGTKSFLITQPNSHSVQGEGVAFAFSIDAADKAKMLQVSYDFNASSTFVASSGTTASDIQMFIYDVTNSVIIPLIPQVITSNGANNFTYKAVFQTASNSTSYKLLWHCSNTSANATGFQFKFDNVAITSQVISQGPGRSDMKAFPMVITGTTTNPTKATTTLYDSAYWAQDGDMMELRYDYGHSNNTGSAVGSGTYLFALPAGYTIDTNKMVANVTYASGICGPAAVTGTGQDAGYVKAYDSTHLAIFIMDPVNEGFYGSGLIGINAADVRISFKARVPIVGWSSNTVSSSDSDTRVCALTSLNNHAQTSGSTITAWTSTTDTHGAWDFNNGIYTCPITGWYKVDFTVPSFGAGSSSYSYASIVANGTSYNGPIMTTNAAIGWTGSATGLYFMLAGQTITCKFSIQSVGTYTPSNAVLTIVRQSGPAVVQASAVCAAKYYMAAASTGNTTTPFAFATLGFDTHGAFNTTTNQYKAPMSGLYRVTSNFASTTAGSVTIAVNGTATDNIGSTAYSYQPSTGIVKVNAGDLIDMRADRSMTTLANTTCWVAFERLGGQG